MVEDIKTNMSITVPKELYALIDKRRGRVSRSLFVSELIEEWFKLKGEKQ